MAITNTALGLQKPDGSELVRDGDNIMSGNAQKIDDLITADRGRLSAIESKNTQQDTDITNARTNAAADAKTYTDGAVAADRTRLTTLEGAGYIPAWKTATAYTAGQSVIAPNGDVVSAKVAFTSGASYAAANWNASAQDGRIGAVEAKQAVKCVRLETGNWIWDTVAGTHFVIPAPDGSLVVRVTAQPVPATTPVLNW